jgi:hypothetical protein
MQRGYRAIQGDRYSGKISTPRGGSKGVVTRVEESHRFPDGRDLSAPQGRQRIQPPRVKGRRKRQLDQHRL